MLPLKSLRWIPGHVGTYSINPDGTVFKHSQDGSFSSLIVNDGLVRLEGASRTYYIARIEHLLRETFPERYE